MITAPAAFEIRDQGEAIATVRLTMGGVDIDAEGVENDTVRALLVGATRKTHRVGYYPSGTNIDGTREMPVIPATEYDTVRWMINGMPAYEVVDLDEGDSA